MRAAIPPTVTYQRDIRVLRNTQRTPESVMPNVFDACLLSDHLSWEYLLSRGGLETCCPTGRKPYANKPWIAMPSEGRRFKPVGRLPIPDLSNPANLDVDFAVLERQVPKGYDGVITDVVCEVTAGGGTGFIEGSGDVTWRLSANRRYLRDLGDIETTLGSLVAPNPVPRGGLRVFSENLLKFTVSFGNNALMTLNPNGIVICSFTGWFYPR